MKDSFVPVNIIFCTEKKININKCMPKGYMNEKISVFSSNSLSEIFSIKENTIVFVDEDRSFIDETMAFFPVSFSRGGLDSRSKRDVPQVLACCGILGKA